MNKLFTFLASAALIGSLSACSSDEPTKGPDKGEDSTGEKAYLSIYISGVGDGIGRATTDGGFTDSDDKSHAANFANEHEVKHAKFLFFDEKGNYVLEGKALNLNFVPAEGDAQGTDKNNIEYINEKNVIVLDKLTETGLYPSYMLTVLNAPDFKAGASLSETLGLLSDYKEKIEDEKNYFIMSTSSYYNNNSTADPNHKDYVDEAKTKASYFATYIKQDNYSTSEETARNVTPVPVYVERLASKVQMTLGASLTPATMPEGVEGDFYEIKQTLAGGDNSDENSITTSGSLVNTKMYLQVLGWDLSAILPKSYMSKNLKPMTEWAFEMWGVTNIWNSIERHRSFWAASTLYDIDPSKIDDNDRLLQYVTNEYKKESNPSLSKLFTNNDKEGNKSTAYCNEYTNTPGKILSNGDVNRTFVTHAVVHARVCDKNGQPINMILSRGVLYEQSEYIAYIIRRINDAQKKLNLWLKVGETETEKDYEQIGIEYFKIAPIEGSTRVGAAKVYADVAKLKAKDLYQYVEATGEGDDAVPAKWVKLTDEAKTNAISTLEGQLTAEQPADASSAIIYDGGDCVYYIPIEHLGAVGSATAAAATNTVGYYGVVRNHWYQLTIDKFTSVGHGIWQPENNKETLEPEGPEEKLYYLGARINILSWKIVKQSVDL